MQQLAVGMASTGEGARHRARIINAHSLTRQIQPLAGGSL